MRDAMQKAGASKCFRTYGRDGKEDCRRKQSRQVYAKLRSGATPRPRPRETEAAVAAAVAEAAAAEAAAAEAAAAEAAAEAAAAEEEEEGGPTSWCPSSRPPRGGPSPARRRSCARARTNSNSTVTRGGDATRAPHTTNCARHTPLI